jgi:protein-tyrosine phosphatase
VVLVALRAATVLDLRNRAANDPGRKPIPHSSAAFGNLCGKAAFYVNGMGLGDRLIDLHSHILPSVDDGAKSLDEAMEMARMAVDDGIQVMACTPHFMPGLYDNDSTDIRHRVAHLNQAFMDQGIDLALVLGGDAHIRPDFVACLQDGRIPTLHNSRYVLFEPPHTVMPQRMDELLYNIQIAGFVPILTHPERLKWIEQSYQTFVDLAKKGVWMQITCGSLAGRFGKRSQYWAQRMLAEGLVSILATDTHNTRSRPPLMAEARELVAKEVGPEEADNLVLTRPVCVLENRDPDTIPVSLSTARTARGPVSFLRRLFGE